MSRVFEQLGTTTLDPRVGVAIGPAIPEEGIATPSSPSRGPSLDLDLMIQQGHLVEQQAAQELLSRLNHARQTFDFVTKQVRSNQTLSRCQMDVWGALEMLNELREYEAALIGDENLDPSMSLTDHAFQCAALCLANASQALPVYGYGFKRQISMHN